MKKFKIHVSWVNPDSGVFEVEAEDEDAACDKLILNNDDIGEDYQIDKVEYLGEVEVKEPVYIDPNQLSLTDCDGTPIAREKFTCFECGAEPTCPYAWDHYNTNGDCLAEK